MSFHAIVRDLTAAMRTKGCPHPVVYGPERTSRATYGETRVVVERPRTGGTDATRATVSQRGSGQKHYATRDVAAIVTAYARSSVSGARIQDHQDLAERLGEFAVDQLDIISRAGGFGPLGFGPAGFVTPADIKDSEVENGAAYAQEVTMASGLARIDTDWKQLMADHAAAVEKPGAADEVVLGGLMLGGPALTFAEVGASGDTITRSFGSFIDDGFAAGDEIEISGSASNNVTATIASLTATVLTLGDDDLANEGPVFGCALRVTDGPGFHAADTTLDASSTADP